MGLKTTSNRGLKSKASQNSNENTRKSQTIKYKNVVANKNSTHPVNNKADPKEVKNVTDDTNVNYSNIILKTRSNKVIATNKNSTVKNSIIKSDINLKSSVYKQKKINIQKLPDNIARRIINNNISLKTRVSKNIKDIRLDSNYENEIGANTFKSIYKTVNGTKYTIKSVKATTIRIRNIPKNYRNIKTKIKNLPTNIKKNVRTASKTVKTAKQKYTAIYTKIGQKNVRGVLEEIPLKRIGKVSKKGVSKILINGRKISTKATIKGVNRFGKSFKQAASTTIDETGNMGTNTVFAVADTLKETGMATIKGAKVTYKGIKTAKVKQLNISNGKIKTRVVRNKISKNVKTYFEKFKTSKITQKEIKKIVKKLRSKIGQLFVRVTTTILKNPFVIGILSIIIVLGLIFSILLNSVLGVHASYFIAIEPNQAQWINNMKKLDKNISNRVSEHEKVRKVRNSGTRADWKDVIIAYYMKNNNDISFSGGTTSLGNGVTSVDPETWEKVFEELKSYLGTPYCWGGADPSTGFDCSGLVQYCYGKYGISLPRTTYEQVLCGHHVDESDLKAGDLVFFGTQNDVHHVGVYIGNGQYLHAPQTGDVVKISDLSSRTDFYEARRVFEEKENQSNNSNNDNSQSSNDNTSKDVLYKSLPNKKELVDIFYKVSEETGVDAILLASIAMTESSLNPNEVSPVGASGLCQLMPETFTGLGFDLSMIFDPYTNVLACAYEVLDLYSYDVITNVEDMLKAYNAGIGNFIKYDGNIPFSETQQYAGKVLGYYSQFSNGEQPSAMQGESIKNNGVNTTLSEVYRCFVQFYKKDGSKHIWILRMYTLEEALDNLKFTDEEKEEFYRFRDYNGNFDEEDQFKDYNVNFKFDV